MLAHRTGSGILKAIHTRDRGQSRRDTAQRLLIERGDAEAVAPLTAALQGKSPLGRLHALWTLEGLGKLDDELVTDAFADKNAAVRASAVFLSKRFIKNFNNPEPVLLQALAPLARDADAMFACSSSSRSVR